MNQNKLLGIGNERRFDTQLKADFMMLIVTILWGTSYLFMKMGLDSLQVFNLIALRFGIAFILAGAVFYKRLIRINFKTFFYGFILGSILFSLISVVTIGLKFTSISNAGFLFSLSVVFVPLLLAIFFKTKPEKRVVIGVGIAIIGIALLTFNNELKINSGDYLIILGALFYAIQIIVTAKLTKNVDSITLGIIQLGVAGAWGLLFSLFFEKPHLPSTTESWVSIMALSVLCSAIGFIGQAVAQKHTTPTHTGLIFSLEPVFAALFAFIFVGETLPVKGYVGAILILIGVLAAEISFKKPFMRKKFNKTVDGSEA
ncbi:threonine/homoserine efflux transporter RhtA [Psychrobacillus insolitus]|uniref:Threonine/homoserine efflux transporter RhtA n=1 Tax=Psychrobacillus insolitus TaxID=1461 RepID=A0A2W7MEI7_9BACI|nr:DMT family transporter [Psychrobacillus insolitus]PZX02405.1 threonine/homoserine efflux transporter RhtA [Psychrobacillus insolitus]